MSALSRRVRKLETKLTDATGLVPHSEAWFDFYEDRLVRLINGEEIGRMRIPIEVLDRRIEEYDREEQLLRERQRASIA
jgi:hypothetical protein